MAHGAINPGADVRSMVEAHVRRFAVVVNPHPGNLLTARLVRGNLLDLGTIGGNRLVATHADIHPGDPGLGALIHAYVAERTRQALSQMHGMSVGDWMDWMFRMNVQKIFDSRGCRRVCGGEDSRAHIGRWA